MVAVGKSLLITGGEMSDYEMPSVYTETYRKAAKPHRCCECYQEILKGHTYQHVKGCWCAKWLEFKTCSMCDESRESYRKEIGETPPFGELREWCFNSDIPFWNDRNGEE